MKIALFAPYFTKPGNKFPVWFEYWQKSAAYNREIDFFVPTNVDINKYTKYENIHFLCMSAEEFWDKLDKVLGFKVYRGYYKTAEYRAFFGILFKDFIRGYDYWGTSEFDVIYGDLMKYLRSHIERGEDVIGKASHLRLIKNTEKLCNLPFLEVKGFAHPLNYKSAFSTEYCWYFDEGGINLRYQQAGIPMAKIDDDFAHIHEMYKYFFCVGKEGKWGFSWQNGKLMGYNNENQEREFMYIHITRRKLSLSDNALPGNTFCLVPNVIINNCQKDNHITPNSFVYTWKKKINRYKKYFKKLRLLSAEDMLILNEGANQEKKGGENNPSGPVKLRKIAYQFKKFIEK